jgi:hypothetical protein
MQSTKVEGAVSQAALLILEQLQSLFNVARILVKGMEEVIMDRINYLRQLQILSPTALEVATCEAV